MGGHCCGRNMGAGRAPEQALVATGGACGWGYSRVSEVKVVGGAGEARTLPQRGWWWCPSLTTHCKQTRNGEMEKGVRAQRAIRGGMAKMGRGFLGWRTEVQYLLRGILLNLQFFQIVAVFLVSCIKLGFITCSKLPSCSQCLAEKLHTEVRLVANPPPHNTCC